MKKLIALLIILSGYAKAQNDFGAPVSENPVKINQSHTQNGDTVIVNISFTVEEGWMVYDSIAGEVGPIPISISYDGSSNVKFISSAKPILKQKYDDIFEVDLWYFQHEANYTFTFVKTNKVAAVAINGEYMACNLTSGVCLPPAPFNFSTKL